MKRNEDLAITMADIDEGLVSVDPTKRDDEALALLPLIVSLTIKQTHYDTLTALDKRELWARAYDLLDARDRYLLETDGGGCTSGCDCENYGGNDD